MKLHFSLQRISWWELGIIAVLVFDLNAQKNEIRFRHLSLEEGLSQSFAHCIVQGDNGFIWVGTSTGINKYNGYTFKVYGTSFDTVGGLSNKHINCLYKDRSGVFWVGTERGLNRFDPSREWFARYQHDPNDPHSLSNNFVLSICADVSGDIWVGTEEGLNRFDHETKHFIRYTTDSNNPNSISSSKIRSVYLDREGTLWIGTENGGLNRFDHEKEQFVCYRNSPDDPASLSNNTVLSICEDMAGVLWIGTYGGGINAFDRTSERFTCYRNVSSDPNSLSDDYINVIFEDRSGELWIGTENGGLNVFNREKNTFVSYQKDPDDPHTLSNNRVLSICEDWFGDIWIGTRGGGVNLYNREAQKFKHYRTLPNNPNSLNDNMIWQIYEDRSGILWIGTDNGGLNKFDRKKNLFTHYMHDPHDPTSISYNRVMSIIEDRAGVFWVGTYRGLHKFNPLTGRFINYRHDPDDPYSLSNDKVLWIYEDRSGVLWLGTKGGGLNIFNRETEQFTSYKHDPNDSLSLSHNRMYYILEDREGFLWIGTNGGGLDKFDREKKRFIHYKHDPDNPKSVGESTIFSLHVSQSGRLWVGTKGGGLNVFNPETNDFTRYTTNDGLPDNTIYNILEDDKGNLWLSTNIGLSRFNPKTGEFKNYDMDDGLQSNEFNSAAAFKSRSGEMFFGGINGFNSFFPDSIRDNPYLPRVVISDFQISNKPVPIGRTADGRTILHRSIVETDEIVLSYRDNVFSFEFAALHYVSPEKNQYAYMMEGLEKEWNYVGNRRYVTYSGLAPGNYTFKVKASNNDGVWNEKGTILKINIIPPFWKTGWFYVVCFIFTVLFAAAAYRYQVRRLKRQKEEEERRRVTANFSQVLEQGAAAVYRRNFKSDVYEYMGEGIKDITGYSAGEITLATWDRIVLRTQTSGDIAYLTLEEIIDQVKEGLIKNWEADFQIRTKSGAIRWVRDMTTALSDESGHCYGCLGIMFDITDRKLAEQKLARTSKELRQKNEEMEADLNMAREVQMALLTDRNWHFPMDRAEEESVLQFTHHYLPASKLAGDFFEIIPISDHQVGVLICDVMGHGTRASLLTFYLRGLIEQLRPFTADPDIFMQKLNRSFRAIIVQFNSAMFATMFYCVADINTYRLRYVNAGHPAPFVLCRNRGIVEKLQHNDAKPNTAIGIRDEYSFVTHEHTLSEDDVVFFYTDGLFEVLGNDRKIFGRKRLFASIQNMVAASPTGMMEGILSEIQNFASSNEFEDDVCMLSMHVRQSGGKK